MQNGAFANQVNQRNNIFLHEKLQIVDAAVGQTPKETYVWKNQTAFITSCLIAICDTFFKLVPLIVDRIRDAINDAYNDIQIDDEYTFGDCLERFMVAFYAGRLANVE